jgi:hypothetical protein
LFSRLIQDAETPCIITRLLPEQFAVIDSGKSVASNVNAFLNRTCIFPKDVCFSLLIPPKRSEQDEDFFRVNDHASVCDVFLLHVSCNTLMPYDKHALHPAIAG